MILMNLFFGFCSHSRNRMKLLFYINERRLREIEYFELRNEVMGKEHSLKLQRFNKTTNSYLRMAISAYQLIVQNEIKSMGI